MNWKLKLVLLFTNLRKPIDGEGTDIKSLRKNAESAARLGSTLFDKKVAVANVYDTNANGIAIRVYKHSDAKDQRVIVYYHGGGFVLYGLDSHDNVCRRLCRMNECIVVSVDYRLAPEHTFPSAHEDAYIMIQWLKDNIASYGGNSHDLVVAGDSAGANLAACMAHRCRNENVRLSAQILIYPWVDGSISNPSIDRNGKGYLLTKESIIWFQKQYTPRKEDQCLPAVSPCFETDFKSLTPAFILTAEFDPLRDDGLNYYKQLKDAGNKAQYMEYPGLVHGFINIPRVDAMAMKAFVDIEAFLKKY